MRHIAPGYDTDEWIQLVLCPGQRVVLQTQQKAQAISIRYQSTRDSHVSAGDRTWASEVGGGQSSKELFEQLRLFAIRNLYMSTFSKKHQFFHGCPGYFVCTSKQTCLCNCNLSITLFFFGVLPEEEALRGRISRCKCGNQGILLLPCLRDTRAAFFSWRWCPAICRN